MAAGQARQAQVTGRSWLTSPVSVLVLGGVLLVLIAVDAPLARLAHQSINASSGSTPVWFTGVIGVLGFVLAWRRRRNPLGWMFLAAAIFLTLSEDASFYTVADYRLHQGGLPLGWVAVLAQPGVHQTQRLPRQGQDPGIVSLGGHPQGLPGVAADRNDPLLAALAAEQDGGVVLDRLRRPTG